MADKINKGAIAPGKHGRLERRQGNYGWFFVLPFVLGFLIIYVDVIINSIAFCFSNVKMGETRYELLPVGLQHFKDALFVNPDFNKNVITSVTSVFTGIPVIIIFSLFIATLLNQKMVGRGFFRALFFVPVILATGIVARAEIGNMALAGYNSMSGVSTGLTARGSAFDIGNIQTLLQELYIGTDLVNFILGIVNNIYDVVNRSGVQIILLLAGLQAISPSIYEAADIEGATAWEKFWKITFPMLSPIIFVCCIYSAIDSFTSSTNPIMIMVADSGLTSVNDTGLAAAMSWMYFIVILAILALFAFIGRYAVFHQEK